jgi:hypothetical protein
MSDHPFLGIGIANPPNVRKFIESLRDTGHTSYTSVTDLVDNSLDADAKNISVHIAKVANDIIIEIFDDGTGMSAKTLNEALRLGSDTGKPKYALGKFGMALTTASFGVARRLEIIAREKGQKAYFGCQDIDEIIAKNEFVKDIREATPEEAALLKTESGALVRLLRTDRLRPKDIGTFAGTLRKKMGQVFRRYIQRGVRMEVATPEERREVESKDPLLLGHPQTRVVIGKDHPMGLPVKVDGGTFYIKAVEAPERLSEEEERHYGTKIDSDHAGFYILRHDREISAALTMGIFSRHPKYARFRADVYYEPDLDEMFNTDFKKSSVDPESSIVDKIRHIAVPILEEIARHLLDDGQKKNPTDYSDLEKYVRDKLFAGRGQTINNPLKKHKNGDDDDDEDDDGGNGHRKTKPGSRKLAQKGGRLKVRYEEGDFPGAPFYLVEKGFRCPIITYNRAHPYWPSYQERVKADPGFKLSFGAFITSLALAELETGFEVAMALRKPSDVILRRLFT